MARPSEERQVRPFVLDYGAEPAGLPRALGRLRAVHLTLPVGIAGVVVAHQTGPDTMPFLVSIGTGIFCAAFWYAFAAIRTPGPAIARTSDQVLLAAVLAIGSLLLATWRTNLTSDHYYWLPYNQTYRFGAAWALQPLWGTLPGVVWVTVLLAFVRVRRRYGARRG